MAASPGRLSEAEKDYIAECYRRGMSGREIAGACARENRPDLPAFEVSASHARRIGRDRAAERGELLEPTATDDLGDRAAVRALFRRQLATADRETGRLERLQANGRLKPTALRDLARATEQLLRMAERIEREPPEPDLPPEPDAETGADDAPTERAAEPDPWLDGMAADAGASERPEVDEAPLADAPLPGSGKDPPPQSPPPREDGEHDSALATRIRNAAAAATAAQTKP